MAAGRRGITPSRANNNSFSLETGKETKRMRDHTPVEEEVASSVTVRDKTS